VNELIEYVNVGLNKTTMKASAVVLLRLIPLSLSEVSRSWPSRVRPTLVGKIHNYLTIRNSDLFNIL